MPYPRRSLIVNPRFAAYVLARSNSSSGSVSMASKIPEHASFGGYSSEVEIELVINGKSFDIAQVGPEWCVVNNPVDLLPCSGEMIVQIDGRPHRRIVHLNDGMSRDSNELQFSAVSAPGLTLPSCSSEA